MPQLRVFVSSTAYDLAPVREQLRAAIATLGHVPVLSDYNGVLYDPTHHTHYDCVAELKNCDLVVLVVGTRFGSDARPEFIEQLDPDRLVGGSREEVEALLGGRTISVTQLEALTAFQEKIPMFVFVHRDMLVDRRVYQANQGLVDEGRLVLPSGTDLTSAGYIVSFLEYIESRLTGNATFEFSRTEDITATLRAQWSALFQRLLAERGSAEGERQILEVITEKIEDLKTSFVVTMPDTDARKVAGGVLRYRLLCELMEAITSTREWLEAPPENFYEALLTTGLEKFALMPQERSRSIYPRSTYLLFKDGRVLESRNSINRIMDMGSDWKGFLNANVEERRLIVEALEVERFRTGVFRPSSLTRFEVEDQAERMALITPQGVVEFTHGGKGLENDA